jgi:hypothetical protein
MVSDGSDRRHVDQDRERDADMAREDESVFTEPYRD